MFRILIAEDDAALRALFTRVLVKNGYAVTGVDDGAAVIEYDSFTVSCGKKRLELPPKEFQLLFKLASSPGRIFTKQQLMDEIWGYDTATDAHTVEVHVGRLRERLADFPDIRIGTVRGVGYKVEKPL